MGRWGNSRVFWDIDSIAPGDDFVEAIDRTLDECSIVLVVIGPYWTAVTDKNGKRRLDNGADYHRLEIERALIRRLRVIPVLVGGAEMPSETELPDSLRSLARRNAFELTDKRFQYDVAKLVETVERAQVPTAPPTIDIKQQPVLKETKTSKPATTIRSKGSDTPSVSVVTKRGSGVVGAPAHSSGGDTLASGTQTGPRARQPTVDASLKTGRMPLQAIGVSNSPVQAPTPAYQSNSVSTKSRLWKPLAGLGIGLVVAVIGSQMLGPSPKKADVSPAASAELSPTQAPAGVRVGDSACVQIGDNLVCPNTTVDTGRPPTITKKAANRVPANCAEIGGNIICPEKNVRSQIPSPNQNTKAMSSAAIVSVEESGSPCVQIGENLVCPNTAANSDHDANVSKKIAKRLPVNCMDIGGNIVCPER